MSSDPFSQCIKSAVCRLCWHTGPDFDNTWMLLTTFVTRNICFKMSFDNNETMTIITIPQDLIQVTWCTRECHMQYRWMHFKTQHTGIILPYSPKIWPEKQNSYVYHSFWCIIMLCMLQIRNVCWGNNLEVFYTR